MDETLDEMRWSFFRLRRVQSEVLAAMPQEKIVAALVRLGDLWRDPAYLSRRYAERLLLEPFPFAMVQVSLDALLDSLTPKALWALIDEEEVRGAQGYPVIGHVVAGNTPLLAWVSIIRALLVRSASFVKLPSGPAAEWGKLFCHSLFQTSPNLRRCVELAEWPGGNAERDAALCAGADLVVAHGNDATMDALRVLCPSDTPFVGYGHRVSFGLVTRGSANMWAAKGLAKDVLLYDQGGCLSPQTIFVEGTWEDALAFAETLAGVMRVVARWYPLPVRAERAAAIVREARDLAQMGEGNKVWGDYPGLRWTVIARPQTTFAPSPTFGVVSVQPLETLEHLPEAVAPVVGYLQGCAVAGEERDYIPNVSYLCAPGELQAPPLSWRQDGRDVLRVLLPPRPYRADGSTTTCISDGNVSGDTASVGEA